MKKLTTLICLVAAFLAFATFSSHAEEETKVFSGKVISILPDQITITMSGTERSFTINKSVVLRNAEDISEIEEGTSVYLRVDAAEEQCLVINAQR